MKTVHLIFNSHIDPIWLWPWGSGLDAALNTCETLCNLLDRHPDATFTRGEAWVYEQIERIDPALFRRIARHVRSGRWEVVGGWYVQPDCNLPGEEGFRKQVELGRAYFQSRFGLFPQVAYNVDSFGHAAFLPRLMTDSGQRHYVMMRPQEKEMALPARVFRWRGEPRGPEVTVFRIAGAYNLGNRDGSLDPEKMADCLSELPPGCDHTMCFVGAGDHGGGPTEEMIGWCRANPEIVPGARLVFSSTARFFRAIERMRRRLPLVSGELQHHAVGCYSVHRAVKRGVRRAEHLLVQAGEALRSDLGLARTEAGKVGEGWRRVCFNHFHDTLGGTCIPSAYGAVSDQLGHAAAVADDVIQHALRRRMARLGSDRRQRIVLGNFGAADFDGWVEHEPWLENRHWDHSWRVLDERGRTVPHQRLIREAIVSWNVPRLLFKVRVPRGGLRTLRIEPLSRKPRAPKGGPAWKLERRAGGLRLVGGGEGTALPSLQLIEDRTDTWSHGVDRYSGRIVARPRWQAPVPMDAGPLVHSWWVEGMIGRSRLEAEWRRYAGEPFVELRLRVTWIEARRVLRLEWRPGDPIAGREDGMPGGGIGRTSDGRERPVRDRTLLRLSDGSTAGAVFPDVFSLSATPSALRLTLLRSAILAHHDPYPRIAHKRLTYSDRGEQAFLFRFYPARAGARAATPERLDADARMLQQAPAVADLTRGMPA